MYSRVLPVTGLWGVCSPGQCLLGSKWNLRDSLFCKLFINFPLWFPSSGLLPVAILCLPHVLKDPCLSSMHCSPLPTQNLQATSPPQGPSLPSPCPRAGSIPLSNESCVPVPFSTSSGIGHSWEWAATRAPVTSNWCPWPLVSWVCVGRRWQKRPMSTDPKKCWCCQTLSWFQSFWKGQSRVEYRICAIGQDLTIKKKKKKKKLYESGCCFPASPSPPLGGSRSSQNTQSFPSSWDVLTPETCIIWAFTKTPSLWDFSWMCYLNL